MTPGSGASRVHQRSAQSHLRPQFLFVEVVGEFVVATTEFLRVHQRERMVMDAAYGHGYLQHCWERGYSIAELWGHSPPVRRATSDVEGDHPILWGILGIAEYQIDFGAGHRYLRERLAGGDWVAIGYRAPKTPFSSLMIVPHIPEAKFGKELSAIGTETAEFIDIRVSHAHYFCQINESPTGG